MFFSAESIGSHKMNPANDPCVVSSREKLKYLDQFNGLHPVNGQVIVVTTFAQSRNRWMTTFRFPLLQVTGAQARDFFLQSQLPPLVLGQIW